jgi:uncharacterized protein with ParB-like and HNH nuclease domain
MSNITPNYRSVQQLLQSQSFSIDEFQREYKWEKEHIDELLSDLQDKFLSSYKNGDETRKVANYEDYFLGSIIVSKRNGKNYLIDGQQRVTSLTLLLIYLYRSAQAKKLPSSMISSIAPLIYSDNLGTPCFNLDIPERLPVVEALFNNAPFAPDGRDESIQNMYSRYGDIEDEDLAGKLDDGLPHFIYWLMTKVGLIEIATDNDNYAYAIFETMNDRGKPLSSVDMLKAYLLAPILDTVQRRNANQIWKQQVLNLISWQGEQDPEQDANFIKAWFRAQYADTTRERKAGAEDMDWELIGSIFHRWARDNHNRLHLGSAFQNISLIQNDFPFFAKAYQLILNASNSYGCTPGLEAVFFNAHNKFTWQNTVLLAPLCTTDDNDTVRRKIAATAMYLDIWLMRRAVNYIRVGYSSAAYSMFLLCRDIRRKPLQELVNILTQKLNNDDVTFEGSSSKGRDGINGLYLNQFSRRYTFHLLARLTSYIEVESGLPDLFDKYVDRSSNNPCDIEHIWSTDYSSYEKGMFEGEKEFEYLRNHVASLLLLPADVNRSLQDMTFKEKAPHYAKQNLYAASLTAFTYEHKPKLQQFKECANLPFKAYENFGKIEQSERLELIRSLVNMIWSPDRLKEVLR